MIDLAIATAVVLVVPAVLVLGGLTAAGLAIAALSTAEAATGPLISPRPDPSP